MYRAPAYLALFAAVALGTAVSAAPSTFQLTIKNRVFTANELTVPANTKIKLLVTNDDLIPAEFESYDLSREVVVPGHSTVVVYLDPMTPGRYNFFNDFNHAAQGWVIVHAPDPTKTGDQK